MSGSDVTPDAVALRAESDAFQAHLERLAELEDRKRGMSPSDPAFVETALEVQRLAATVLADAEGQTAIGAAAHREGVVTPIEDVPADLSASEILTRWRASERKLASLAAGSDEARHERAQIEAYRRAYASAFNRKLSGE